MPPAVRPCGRTFFASKVSSEESEETNTRRSSSSATAANTTSSPSFTSMTGQESMVVGASRFQRLTTPLRVPMASDGSGLASAVVSPSPPFSPLSADCSMAIAVTTRSPRTGSVDSVMLIRSSAWTPPCRESVADAGKAGRSTTCASTRRPAEVTRP